MTPAFHSWGQFFAMGGYGFYFWLSLFVTLAALLVLIIHSLIQRKRLLTQVLQRQAREQRIRAARRKSSAANSTGEGP